MNTPQQSRALKAAKLEEAAQDQQREIRRLERLLKRQTAKRNRLNKTIANTRRRLQRAVETNQETTRAAEALTS